MGPPLSHGWSGCSDRGIQTRRLIGQAGSDWMGGGEEGLVLACRRRPPPWPSPHNSPQARPQHAGGPVCSGRGAASPPGGPMVAPGFCWPPRHLPAEPISSLPALGLRWGGLFQRSTGAVGATETGWAPQGTGFLSLLSLQASGRGGQAVVAILGPVGPFLRLWNRWVRSPPQARASCCSPLAPAPPRPHYGLFPLSWQPQHCSGRCWPSGLRGPEVQAPGAVTLGKGPTRQARGPPAPQPVHICPRWPGAASAGVAWGRLAQLGPSVCDRPCALRLGLSFQFCFLVGNARLLPPRPLTLPTCAFPGWRGSPSGARGRWVLGGRAQVQGCGGGPGCLGDVLALLRRRWGAWLRLLPAKLLSLDPRPATSPTFRHFSAGARGGAGPGFASQLQRKGCVSGEGAHWGPGPPAAPSCPAQAFCPTPR